ncbi:T9SS type A sorting domain-containing protein [candidate division KSB1 bacterium]|nr:T9SS type A sorting domain-containing protein [candidate division KSB1 bacterium]
MYKIKSINRIILTVFVIGLLMMSVTPGWSQAPKHIWTYIYNSDGSIPANGDISIRAYLQKYPSGVINSSNVANGWTYDINQEWTFYPNPDEAGLTNATVGDVIVIEFENTSGGPFDGESNVLTGVLDENMYQQIGSNNFSLPIELSDFSATEKNGIVMLKWSTETETTNLGYNVYRTQAGLNQFEKINQSLIPGAGTTTLLHKYSFEDNNVEFGKQYEYKIENVNSDGSSKFYGPVSISIDSQKLPEKFELSQNYPNPFNPETSINYCLPKNTHVTIVIYNTLGKIVNELVNKTQTAGTYTVTWDGRSNTGTHVSSGMYFYQINAEEFTQVKKMIFSK